MESNGKSNQQLKVKALLIMLLAFVGVAGGLDLYTPLQARAANEVIDGPRGNYYNNMGGSLTTKYKGMLTKKPANFPAPETLWTTSGYQMVYNGSSGNATTSLRHQVFLPPVAANGIPPSTVKYYNPTDYPTAWTDDQYKAWDRYSGIVTNPTTKKKEFQVVGTAIPYRWFHTTYVNHRVQIIAQVQNKTKGTTKYVSTEAEILPMTQSRRYMYSYWNDSAMKTTNKMANANKWASSIIPDNYFSGSYGMYFGAPVATLRKEVSKICGLGIVGAGSVDTSGTKACNYLYDFAGFQANIPIEELMLDGNTGGRDKITINFKIALSVNAPSGGTNYMVAHLDILTDIQTEVPVYDGVGYKLGTIEVHKYGENKFDAKDRSITRNPLLARTTHYNIAGDNDNSAVPYLSSEEGLGKTWLSNRYFHLRNSFYLNKYGISNAYHYNKSSGTNKRNFRIYDNLHVSTVVGAASYSGVQYGWKQGGTSWGSTQRASDPYKDKTRAGFAYAPSEYFYTNSLSINVQFVPNPDPSVNVNVYYIDKYNKKNVGEFKPNPESINIRKSQGNVTIKPNKNRMTVNRGGREWQFVATTANPGSVTRSFTNSKDVYFEYERVPDPEKEISVYYMNKQNHGQRPTTSNMVNGIKPNPKKIKIKFKDTLTDRVADNQMVVNDALVPRRKWKFEEYVGNPRSNTLKYDVGDDGAYNVTNTNVKNLSELFYYYTRYDDVLIRYVDADTINNTGGPTVIVSKNSPRYEELAFNNTLTVEAEDEFISTNGLLWQLDDGQAAYPRIQSRTNNKADGPTPITFLYRRPYNVKVEHRQLLSDGTPGGTVTGEVLHREDFDLRLDRYATFSAKADGTIPNHPKHNYVGAISVDGGTTIIPHDPRQVEMLVKKGMNQIIFYYMEPVLCDTGGPTFNGPNLVSCEVKSASSSDPTLMMPYVNGYLAKLGDDAVNNSAASSYVYNYAPMIQPKGIFAVRAVDVRAVGGGKVETSNNDKSVTYLTESIDELKPKKFQAPNINTTTNVKVTNAPNPKSVSVLAQAADPLNMANWGDKTGVNLILDSTSINKGTLGDVEFVTSYKYIDTVQHNYRPTLVYNGVTYMAEYVDTTLDYEQQKAVEFTTEVDDAGHDYGESFGNAGTSEFMYTVGFERKALPELNGEGKTVIKSEIRKFYEVFSNAYDSHTQTYDTQRAVEVNNKIYYANMLAYTDLPYLTEATKSKREGTNANVLTFDKDNMWYLIGHYDEQNPTLDSQLVDVSSIYNATEGTTLENFLDSKVGKRFNTSVIPDPMAGEYLLNYDKVIPMVYGKYTDESIGQSLEFITKDVFAVGSDSGYQVVVKDARVEPNAANWKNGWSDVDVYTGEQYGANNSIKVLTDRNILVDALTNDLGLTHAVSDSDKLVTKGRGSLFFLPVDIKLDPVAGNDRYHNRIVVTDLGLNDATYFQDDIITVDTYLFGRGNDVIYSPQRLEIEEGQQVEDIDVLINNAAVNDYKNIPSEQWKTSNGTRMVYSPVIKPFIKSTP